MARVAAAGLALRAVAGAHKGRPYVGGVVASPWRRLVGATLVVAPMSDYRSKRATSSTCAE